MLEKGTQGGTEALTGVEIPGWVRWGEGRNGGYGILGEGEAKRNRTAAVRSRGKKGCRHAQQFDPRPKTQRRTYPYPHRLSSHCSGPSAASQPGTSQAVAPGS